MSRGAHIQGLPPEESKAAARSVDIPDAIAELNIFRVLLKHPQIAKLLNDFLLSLLLRGKLDARLRELVIMRIGWATASEYEWAQHWRIARDFGVSDEDLLGLRHWSDHPAFGPVERVVLAATDEVVASGAVSEATLLECQSHFNEEELIELLFVMGLWNMVSTFLRSTAIPLEDGVDPWPPDGQTPHLAKVGGGPVPPDEPAKIRGHPSPFSPKSTPSSQPTLIYGVVCEGA